MRPVPRPLLVLPVLLSTFTVRAQQPSAPAVPSPQRDPQAVAALQKAVVAMGSTVPQDSVATGTIDITAGTAHESGSIKILTRGTDQTSEQISTATRNYTFAYSRRLGSELNKGTTRRVSLERAVSSRSAIFPLPLLAGPASNTGYNVKYIGIEQVDGCSCIHIQISDSFSDNPRLQVVSEVSQKEIWIDSTSGLVHRVFFQIRNSRGAGPVIPVEITFSNYRIINGVSYPFTIETSKNGVPYSTITIQNVLFNTGLQDSSFTLR